MSCGRLRRELLDLFRFGGLDGRSAPHLEHLAECRPCRDEVGIDRVLVERLRVALAERVAGASPPSAAWSTILARSQTPERGFRGWLGRRVLPLFKPRVATGATAVALAAIIALGTDVTIQPLQPWSSPSTDSITDGSSDSGRIAFAEGPGRTVELSESLARRAARDAVNDGSAETFVLVAVRPQPEIYISVEPRILASRATELPPDEPGEASDDAASEAPRPDRAPPPLGLAR